jgi:hypothetical protein
MPVVRDVESYSELSHRREKPAFHRLEEALGYGIVERFHVSAQKGKLFVHLVETIGYEPPIIDALHWHPPFGFEPGSSVLGIEFGCFLVISARGMSARVTGHREIYLTG